MKQWRHWLQNNSRRCWMAGALALAYLLGVSAGLWGGAIRRGERSSSDAAPGREEARPLFEQTTELTIVMGSHESWPYRADQLLWKYLQEATNTSLKVFAYPMLEYPERLGLMLATRQNLPDLIHVTNADMMASNVNYGLFESVDDHLELMPNYIRFFDSLPAAERRKLMVQRIAGDGEIYAPPVYGTETISNVMGWMVRKDIFQKHGLAMPTTLDEVREAARTLKEIYPSSYPISIRNGLRALNLICPAFRNNFSYGVYYDFVLEEWAFGACDELMKTVAAYFAKLHAEGLVPPNYVDISDWEWEHLVSNDQGFIMPEYLVRLDYFNLPNRQRDPAYTWAMIPAPKAKLPTGQNKLSKNNVDLTGYIVCNAGDPKRVENAFRFLDWMYSDEGSLLLSWGKKDEDYVMLGNAEKQHVNPKGEDLRYKYGFGTYGVTQRVDPLAMDTLYSEEQRQNAKIGLAYMEDEANPSLWLTFGKEDQAQVDHVKRQVFYVADGWLQQFITNQKSLSEWDIFQKQLKDAGVDRLVAFYDAAYTRAMSKYD